MDAAMASLLAEFPSLARLDDGRVKCALTGHVMLAKPDVVQPYVKCAPGAGPGPAIARDTICELAISEVPISGGGCMAIVARRRDRTRVSVSKRMTARG
jgi:hypothetical protein